MIVLPPNLHNVKEDIARCCWRKVLWRRNELQRDLWPLRGNHSDVNYNDGLDDRAPQQPDAFWKAFMLIPEGWNGCCSRDIKKCSPSGELRYLQMRYALVESRHRYTKHIWWQFWLLSLLNDRCNKLVLHDYSTQPGRQSESSSECKQVT